MGDRRFRVAQTSFSDHPFSAETLLCVDDRKMKCWTKSRGNPGFKKTKFNEDSTS